MSEPQGSPSYDALREAIGALDALLSEETEALRHLDHEALDALTDRKLKLLGSMNELTREGADRSLLISLKEVRDKALMNQVLMVHARDLSQGMIHTLTAAPNQEHMPGPRLLQVRG